MKHQKALRKCIISHSKWPSWNRNIVLSLTPNSQGKPSKRGVRSVWSLYVWLVTALNLKLWAVYWKEQWDGVNQRETGKGVPLSDCSHSGCQISDPLVVQLFIESLWKHNGRQGWPWFSVADISSFLIVLQGLCYKLKVPATWKELTHQARKPFLLQKALIFKLANLEGADLTRMISNFAISETASVTRELGPPRPSLINCFLKLQM